MTRKTTDIPRLTGRPVGELVPMPHGGALRAGGTNRGGPGRPAEAIRGSSRAAYDHIVAEIASRDLATLCASELALLANTVGRYGLGTEQRVEVAPRAMPLGETERAERLAALLAAHPELYKGLMLPQPMNTGNGGG